MTSAEAKIAFLALSPDARFRIDQAMNRARLAWSAYYMEIGSAICPDEAAGYIVTAAAVAAEVAVIFERGLIHLKRA